MTQKRYMTYCTKMVSFLYCELIMTDLTEDSPTGKKFTEAKHLRGPHGEFLKSPEESKKEESSPSKPDEEKLGRAKIIKQKPNNSEKNKPELKTSEDLADGFCKANGFKRVSSENGVDYLKKGLYRIKYTEKNKSWVLSKNGSILKTGTNLPSIPKVEN